MITLLKYIKCKKKNAQNVVSAAQSTQNERWKLCVIMSSLLNNQYCLHKSDHLNTLKRMDFVWIEHCWEQLG